MDVLERVVDGVQVQVPVPASAGSRGARGRVGAFIAKVKGSLSAEVGTSPRRMPDTHRGVGRYSQGDDPRVARKRPRGTGPLGTRFNYSQLKAISDACVGMALVKAALKGVLGFAEWNMVTDLDAEFAELDEWEQVLIRQSRDRPAIIDFEPELLHERWQTMIRQHTSGLQRMDAAARHLRVSEVFGAVRDAMEREARQHGAEVERLLRHPNDDLEPSWRHLVNLVLEDLLVWDAGIIVANPNQRGDRVAELYYLPAHEVHRWAAEDRTVPDPPAAAYTWEHPGRSAVQFTKNDIIYLVRQPQPDGYGRSPVEMAIATMTAALAGDKYELEMLSEQNIPPAVIDLGNVSDAQRDNFMTGWADTVTRAGRGNIIATNFQTVSEKQGLKIHELNVRTPDEMGMNDFRMWTLRIMAACCNLSMQDLGFVEDFHRTTAEVQMRLSVTRGFGSWLKLFDDAMNSQLIKRRYPWHDTEMRHSIIDREEDRQERTDERADMQAGLESINGVRAKRGERPIEGGDTHTITTPMGLVPVETMASAIYRQRAGVAGAAGPGGAAAPPASAEEQEGNIVRPEEHLAGLSPQEEGVVSPTIGNPWLEMSDRLGNIVKAEELPMRTRQAADQLGGAIMQALDEERWDDAKAQVAQLVYRLRQDSGAAMEPVEAVEGAKFVGTYSDFIRDMGDAMFEVIDDVAGQRQGTAKAARPAGADALPIGHEVIDWFTDASGKRIPITRRVGSRAGHEGQYVPEGADKPVYVYSEEWQSERARRNWEASEQVGDNLDVIGESIRELLSAPDGSREQQLGAVVGLMLHGRMRVGSGSKKAEEAGTVGAATLRRKHVTVAGSKVTLEWPGKGGVPRQTTIVDERLTAVVNRLLQGSRDQQTLWSGTPDGDGPGEEQRLFPDVEYDDILDWCKRWDVTPKAFRTFNANKLFLRYGDEQARAGLPGEEQERRKAISKELAAIIKRVATAMGHTPSTCKRSYLNPALLEAYKEARAGKAREAA